MALTYFSITARIHVYVLTNKALILFLYWICTCWIIDFIYFLFNYSSSPSYFFLVFNNVIKSKYINNTTNLTSVKVPSEGQILHFLIYRVSLINVYLMFLIRLPYFELLLPKKKNRKIKQVNVT